MKKLGIIMDPIETIQINHDTSFALMLEGQKRGWEIYYLTIQNIWLQEGIVWGHMQQLIVLDNQNPCFQIQDDIIQPLSELDCILMRKDPPFNMEYIYLTYLLEQVEAQEVMVINRPASLRDANEKLFTSWFPQCCPKTLVSAQREIILDFIEENETCVIKTLDSMAGNSILMLTKNDPNLNSIIDLMTGKGREHVMVQEFIPAVREGDKRIFMINGEAFPIALARIPAENDFRANLAAGGHGIVVELSEHDHWIAEQVGPELRKRGLDFVGLDVIGDYLTEINVTSPTCAREIEQGSGFNVCAKLFDYLESKMPLSQ